MKVAMVTPSASRSAGGIFEVERRISQNLASFPGVQVGVFSLIDAWTQADLPSWQPLIPHLFPVLGPRAYGWSPAMASALFNWNPDVVHLHALWMHTSVVTLRWRHRTRRPVLITPHGMLDPWALKNSAWKKKLALRLFERHNLAGASCIQAFSVAEHDAIRAMGLINPVAIIPNGIDLPESGNPTTAATPKGDRRMLLFLGRLHPKKGLVSLIDAWTRFRQTGPAANRWTLAIAGWDQGGHEATLQAQADALGLVWRRCPAPEPPDSVDSTSVFFLGPRFGADKDKLLRGCDAFILPSLSEGLPMAVLEAWAHGKPVLMTPMCHLPEGFAADAALEIAPTVESIADGLTKLAHLSDAERKEIGARGQRLVEARFTWPQVTAQLREVNEWLIHGGKEPLCVTR